MIEVTTRKALLAGLWLLAIPWAVYTGFCFYLVWWVMNGQW